MQSKTNLQNRNVNDSFLLLMTINSIVGAGVFLNTKPLTLLAGKFGPFAYLIGLLVMLPVVLTTTGLAQAKPVAGGMYKYVSDILGSKIAFISTWAYFLAKIASIAVLIQGFCLPIKLWLQNPLLQETLLLEFVTLSTLALLNIFGVKLYGKVQLFFSTIKIIPLISISALACTILFTTNIDFPALFSAPTDILASFPIAIFAMTGFEVASTMAHTIQNPENIRRIILKALFLVIGAYTVFQFSAQLLGGIALGNSTSPMVFLANILNRYVNFLGHIAGLCMRLAALAGAFNILANNCWNLIVIAQQQTLPFSGLILNINKHFVPWIAIIIEVILSMLVMLITSHQVALQSMSVMAVAVCFLIVSTSALFYWLKTQNYLESSISAWSIASCLIVLLLSIQNVSKSGLSVTFVGFFALGIMAAIGNSYYQAWQTKNAT